MAEYDVYEEEGQEDRKKTLFIFEVCWRLVLMWVGKFAKRQSCVQAFV